MLKEAVASKAAKLLMTCVCPVAGTTALSLGVPQVRDAVYKATQPRQYAKPKTRVRQDEAAAPAQLAANEACPPVTPFQFRDLPPTVTTTEPGTPETPTTPPTNPLEPRPPFVPQNPVPLFVEPSVPEPSTWIQLILGFGLIGVVTRFSYRKVGSSADKTPAVAGQVDQDISSC